MEFKSFPKIEKFDKLFMSITQKIHGSNAQIVIFPKYEYLHPDSEGKCGPEIVGYDIKVGSRNRWITPLDDNFGFAAWVEKNKEEIILKLGEGTHFGEWAGPGINSGEGLAEKTFVLFEHRKFPPERPLPPNTRVVPLLYSGRLDFTAIDIVMADLKSNGSKLADKFMRPEGIVVQLGNTRYKKTFEAEETGWTKPSGIKSHIPYTVDLSHLLQPMRLEKLLSRDEVYLVDYPASLGNIAQDYVKDLEEEGQLVGEPEVVKGIKKQLGKQLYPFIKIFFKERYNV